MLGTVDIFNILCIRRRFRGTDLQPNYVSIDARTLCVKRRAMLIVDPPSDVDVGRRRRSQA